jgi:hypothetical protein
MPTKGDKSRLKTSNMGLFERFFSGAKITKSRLNQPWWNRVKTTSVRPAFQICLAGASRTFPSPFHSQPVSHSSLGRNLGQSANNCLPANPVQIVIAQTGHLTVNERRRCRNVAQPGRALGLGPRRRRFKSCRSDHFLIFVRETLFSNRRLRSLQWLAA